MTRNSRILRALEESGKSRADLAKALNVTRATISDRLNAEKEIDSYDFLAAVSRLTGRSIEWLAEGVETPGDTVVRETPEAYRALMKEVKEAAEKSAQEWLKKHSKDAPE